MTIQLAPAVEQAIRAEAEATGLTPDEVANNHLASLTSPPVRDITVAEYLAALPPDPAADARAQAALNRLAEIRKNISPEFGPKPGQSYRDWIHEGHKYY